MNRVTQLWLYWVVVIIFLALLHSLIRWQTVSLVSLPFTLSVILAFTVRRPWLLFLLLMTIAELMSQVPAGMMAVAILLPLALAYIPTRPPAGLSWLFFLYGLLIVTTQALWLSLGAFFWQHHIFSWAAIPTQLPTMIFSSAIAAVIAIIVWREWIEPLPLEKTVPRYRQVR